MRKTDRLPSLNALRAFEAVGRTLSFAGAAREMNVSPSAVSHQVRQLEADLAVALLARDGKSVRLTAAGARMLPELTAGFAGLRRALALAEGQDGGRPLRVTMLPTFAARWLIPRLAGFYEQHGGLEIVVETSTDVVDLGERALDCAIRFGRGSWSGLAADRLFPERFTPVCSPKLKGMDEGSRTIDALARQTLIQVRPRSTDWDDWFTCAGARPTSVSISAFDTRDLAIQAAIEGLGVALADPRLVVGDERAGRLFRPFGHHVGTSIGAYYLVYRDELSSDATFAAFRRWLIVEAGAYEAAGDR